MQAKRKTMEESYGSKQSNFDMLMHGRLVREALFLHHQEKGRHGIKKRVMQDNARPLHTTCDMPSMLVVVYEADECPLPCKRSS
jgi:hypothetical protein